MPSLEYLAGYFDGEGCVGLYPRSESRTFTVEINITSAHRPMVELFLHRFGGFIMARKNYANKPLFAWRLQSKQEALDCLRALQPFSIEKRQQIDVAIEWLERSVLYTNREPHSEPDLAHGAVCCARLRELKQVLR